MNRSSVCRPATPFALSFLVTVAAALAGCGGGGGADGTGAPVPMAPSTFSTGVMTKGSVILNGVRFDDSSAQVSDDRGRGVAHLADGMRVKLSGRIDDSGTTGTADRIKIDTELRGTVTAVNANANPPSFIVGGVQVFVDDTTVFDDGATLANLAGAQVEVHGLPGAGSIHASRVEATTGAGLADEIRGTITRVLSPDVFEIGNVAVTIGSPQGVVFSPAGCGATALVVGRVVEIHGAFTGNNAFAATRIECEDLADEAAGVRPTANARTEVEGLVASLNSNASSFTLGNLTVVFGSGTQFRNGSIADLAEGVRVEVDGSIDGTTLSAREVSFKRERIIVQGPVTSVLAGPPASLVVLGQNVVLNDLTKNSVSGRLAVGTTVQVRGTLSAAGVLVADEVRDGSGGDDGREILQGRVTAKTTSTITVLGVTVRLPANASYRQADGTRFSSVAAFLEAVNASPAGGTLVKVRGEPLSTNLEEVEIEG